MAERSSAIHFCPLLTAPAGAGQKTTDNGKTLFSLLGTVVRDIGFGYTLSRSIRKLIQCVRTFYHGWDVWRTAHKLLNQALRAGKVKPSRFPPEYLQFHILSRSGPYLPAVRQLAGHYRKSPDQVIEEELRQYFLFFKNENMRHASPTTTAIFTFLLPPFPAFLHRSGL
jgi:hypothetical protein